MVALEQISGGQQLTTRFGGWPSFHDAEVTRFELDRHGPNFEFVIHAWAATNEVDDRGDYLLNKHTLIRIRLEHVASSELSEFNQQNVLFDLSVEPEVIEGSPGFRVMFDASYGLSGFVTCARVVVVAVTPCDG